MAEGNGNGDAQRALEEIRELRRTTGEAIKEQTAALNAINTKLGHIEGMVGGQAEGNTNRDRRTADLERQVDDLKKEIANIRIEAAALAAAGAPLHRLGYLVIGAIVLGFGGLIATGIARPQVPPNITIQMPASTAP